MGIGVKYDDGSGSMKPLASYKGMASPWATSKHGLFGTNPAQRRVGKAASFQFGGSKSLVEKMRERREGVKSLNKADPRVNGKVIGVRSAVHPLEADDNSRGASEHTPWSRAVMTGLHFEREAPTGRIIVWAYLRTDKFTGEGRCFETTGESKVPVYAFFDNNADSLPWSFSEAGWKNCRLQIGLDCDWVSPDLIDERSEYHLISGTDKTAPGAYCIVVDLTQGTVKIEQEYVSSGKFFPEQNKVKIPLGTVVEKTDSSGNRTVSLNGNMHINPVIYKYV